MKKNKVISISYIISVLIYYIWCANIDGYFDNLVENESLLNYMAFIFYIIIVFFICTYIVDIIICELTNLLLGLKCKWKINSFYIMGINFIIEDNKIKIKKLFIPIVSGITYIHPKDETQNATLPIYGSIIANIITAVISILLYTLANNTYLKILLIALIVTNIYNAIISAIPLQINAIYKTPMKTILEIKKSIKNNTYKYIFKEIELEEIYNTKDIKTVDDKKFLLKEPNDNIYIEQIHSTYVEKLILKNEFKKAEEYILKSNYTSFENEKAKLSFTLSLLLAKIILKDNKNIIRTIYYKPIIQNNIKGIGPLMSLELYAYYKIIEKNTKKTNYYLKQVNNIISISQSEEYKKDIQNLINIIDNIKED